MNANNKDITLDTVLSVKEAARLTNKSVPNFYTERNKERLGFYKRDEWGNLIEDEKGNPVRATEGQWLISVRDLVEWGYLNDDFEPTTSERLFGEQRHNDDAFAYYQRQIDDLKEQIEALQQRLAEEVSEKQVAQALADERAKQIEMIDALLIASGLKKE